MKTLICDIETNGWLHELTHLWCLQVGDADGTDAVVYGDYPGCDRPLQEGLERLKTADRLVFHNGFRFDVPALERLYPGLIDPTIVYDTLVAARLSDPGERMNSLEEWGRRLGVHKGDFTGSFYEWDPAMIEYARQDVKVTRQLYRKVEPIIRDWGCVDLEMRFAYVMGLQETNGFTLDVDAAQKLDAELSGELARLTTELRNVFPPRYVPLRVKGGHDVCVPKRNDRSRGYTAGCPFTRVQLEVFNPGSRHQVADRLVGLGWKPKVFGADGHPTLDEEVLARLPYPEAQALIPFFEIQKKIAQISEGKSAWLKHVKPDGRVHGSVNTVGCAPGRCSHASPNMAQVNKDPRMRACWRARQGWKLVGCDGASIQARGLAHYLAPYDGGAAIQREAYGDKELGTDTHSANREALLEIGFGGGVVPSISAVSLQDAPPDIAKPRKRLREGAKRCLYCVLFGGGDVKLGKTFKEEMRGAGLTPPKLSDKALGAQARTALFKAISGFEDLAADIGKAAKKRGWLKALSGFRIPVRSPHSALVFLMQGFEQSIMKCALVIFHFERASQMGWKHGVDYGYCSNVHDEVQIECRPEIAEAVGMAMADSIQAAGLRLGSRCPMVGEYSIGDHWGETH
jgi:DNA polymerase-1